MSLRGGGALARVAAMAAVAVAILRPILFSAGVPALRHDWIWPLTPGGVAAAMLNLSAPVVGTNWNAAGWLPRIDVVQPLVLLANAAAGPAIALRVLLLAILLTASVGAYRLAKSYGAREAPALLAALWYTAAPFAVVELVAGHLWILAAYAAFPHAVEALLARRRWYAAFFWFATTAIDVHFLGFDLLAMLALALVGGVRPREMGGAFAGLCAFVPSLIGVAFAA
ncbi:MAG TPA: hypothetical protein VMH02_08455, partial [Verrucomicrobiae bacterium]|nr:hypothetical protein [Verrucomicrobiae bacterium]